MSTRSAWWFPIGFRQGQGPGQSPATPIGRPSPNPCLGRQPESPSPARSPSTLLPRETARAAAASASSGGFGNSPRGGRAGTRTGGTRPGVASITDAGPPEPTGLAGGEGITGTGTDVEAGVRSGTVVGPGAPSHAHMTATTTTSEPSFLTIGRGRPTVAADQAGEIGGPRLDAAQAAPGVREVDGSGQEVEAEVERSGMEARPATAASGVGADTNVGGSGGSGGGGGVHDDDVRGIGAEARLPMPRTSPEPSAAATTERDRERREAGEQHDDIGSTGFNANLRSQRRRNDVSVADRQHQPLQQRARRSDGAPTGRLRWTRPPRISDPFPHGSQQPASFNAITAVAVAERPVVVVVNGERGERDGAGDAARGLSVPAGVPIGGNMVGTGGLVPTSGGRRLSAPADRAEGADASDRFPFPTGNTPRAPQAAAAFALKRSASVSGPPSHPADEQAQRSSQQSRMRVWPRHPMATSVYGYRYLNYDYGHSDSQEYSNVQVHVNDGGASRPAIDGAVTGGAAANGTTNGERERMHESQRARGGIADSDTIEPVEHEAAVPEPETHRRQRRLSAASDFNPNRSLRQSVFPGQDLLPHEQEQEQAEPRARRASSSRNFAYAGAAASLMKDRERQRTSLISVDPHEPAQIPITVRESAVAPAAAAHQAIPSGAALEQDGDLTGQHFSRASGATAFLKAGQLQSGVLGYDNTRPSPEDVTGEPVDQRQRRQAGARRAATTSIYAADERKRGEGPDELTALLRQGPAGLDRNTRHAMHSTAIDNAQRGVDTVLPPETPPARDHRYSLLTSAGAAAMTDDQRGRERATQVQMQQQRQAPDPIRVDLNVGAIARQRAREQFEDVDGGVARAVNYYYRPELYDSPAATRKRNNRLTSLFRRPSQQATWAVNRASSQVSNRDDVSTTEPAKQGRAKEQRERPVTFAGMTVRQRQEAAETTRREQAQEALMMAAQRNVRGYMGELNDEIYEERGRAPPDWAERVAQGDDAMRFGRRRESEAAEARPLSAQTQTRAPASLRVESGIPAADMNTEMGTDMGAMGLEPMTSDGRIHVGGGRYVTEEDITNLARARLQDEANLTNTGETPVAGAAEGEQQGLTDEQRQQEEHPLPGHTEQQAQAEQYVPQQQEQQQQEQQQSTLQTTDQTSVTGHTAEPAPAGLQQQVEEAAVRERDAAAEAQLLEQESPKSKSRKNFFIRLHAKMQRKRQSLEAAAAKATPFRKHPPVGNLLGPNGAAANGVAGAATVNDTSQGHEAEASGDTLGVCGGAGGSAPNATGAPGAASNGVTETGTTGPGTNASSGPLDANPRETGSSSADNLRTPGAGFLTDNAPGAFPVVTEEQQEEEAAEQEPNVETVQTPSSGPAHAATNKQTTKARTPPTSNPADEIAKLVSTTAPSSGAAASRPVAASAGDGAPAPAMGPPSLSAIADAATGSSGLDVSGDTEPARTHGGRHSAGTDHDGPRQEHQHPDGQTHAHARGENADGLKRSVGGSEGASEAGTTRETPKVSGIETAEKEKLPEDRRPPTEERKSLQNPSTLSSVSEQIPAKEDEPEQSDGRKPASLPAESVSAHEHEGERKGSPQKGQVSRFLEAL